MVLADLAIVSFGRRRSMGEGCQQARRVACCFISATLALVLSACSSSAKSSQFLKLPSGRIIKVQRIWQLYAYHEDPALMLDYETNVPLTDQVRLRTEVDEIWPVFKTTVEAGQFKSASITAYQAGPGRSWWRLKPLGYAFRYKKQPDGSWLCSDRQKGND